MGVLAIGWCGDRCRSPACPDAHLRAGYCVLPACECAGTGELVKGVWWALRALGEMWLSGVGASSVMHAGRRDEPLHERISDRDGPVQDYRAIGNTV
jgi:hypothetical protein